MERLELKFAHDAGEAGLIEGIASPIGGTPDRVRDIVAPGAFARTLAEHKAADAMPAMLVNHDPKAVAGTWLQMTETSEGLRVSGRLALGTADGDRAYALAKSKAITGLSIGYRAIRATAMPGGIRRLEEIDLL